ncbi:hypothetical protein JTE90_026562 [Oedothorax gibbosus]|uniref:Uncharacterized protein n=1 Tax=Oedothorax gibbosus TaxID=931172 RepID=A0AAV6U083_9ARAC|nr:hypothetical protein JTE90_026562 [Oedothorax gibbosus]
MRNLLIILIIGCASAFYVDASDNAAESFNYGMEQEKAEIEDRGVPIRFESDVQDELAKYLREMFDRTLKKIDEAFKNGKDTDVNKEALRRLKELKDKMDELEIEDHEVDKFKEQLDYHLREILRKMGILD